MGGQENGPRGGQGEGPTEGPTGGPTGGQGEGPTDKYLSFLSFIESVWKAGPQLTLQVYIKLTTNTLGTLQCKNQWSTVLSLQLSCSYVARLVQFLNCENPYMSVVITSSYHCG